MKKLIILFVILLSCIYFSCGQETTSPNIINVSIQISDHILQSYFVTSIAFDSKGTAWIGTFKQGLIKYDGIATYYNSKNSTLPDSIVMRDIAVDKNDNIWIGSDAGLIKYDKMHFTLYNTSNSPLAEDVVWSIAIDDNNILWFASCRFRQGGLMKYDGENWTIYTPENSELPSNSVRDVIVDSRNNKWVAMSEVVNNGCIIKITGDYWTIFDKEDIGFIPYYFGNLAVDIENNVYASLDYGLSSLWDMTRPNILKYNDKNWTIINPVDENGESLGYVGKINIDLLGNIWASLQGREDFVLSVYNGKKWIYNNSDFPIDWISEISIDENNTVWLGTGNGIYLVRL
jgi:ligand-binding sensor domain-containing protein